MTREYLPEDKMISLISNDYRILQVLSRFGIPLGFSDKTIEEVCESGNVDCNTFLAIVNFIILKEENQNLFSKISLHSLLQYLIQSHSYFLDFFLPSIRRKLLDAINLKASDVSFLIIKLFDEYVDSIREHMQEEELHLFHSGEQICKPYSEFPVYSRHHEEVGAKLRELKNIIIKYCPPDSSTNLLNDALYDLYRCEEELISHCKIEDNLLIPIMKSQSN